MVGFHFSSIAIGPFSIGLQYGRVKFQIKAQTGALGYAGMHTDRISGLRRKLLIFGMAGPLTNLVTGALAAAFIVLSPQAERSTWPIALSAAFSMLSLLLFTLSAMPFRSTFHSDGDRVRMLVNSSGEARRWIAAMVLAGQQRKGVRPLRWKQAWLQAVCAVRDSSIDEFFGNLLAHIAASDRKDISAEASHLERCLELAHLAPVTARDLVASESLYFCAWTRCDSKLAESWHAQLADRRPITPLIGIRTETALACARRDFKEALAQWQKGPDFISQLPSSRIKETLEESWREWGKEITEKSELVVTK